MSQHRKAKLKKREEHRQRAEQKKFDFFDGTLRHAGLLETFNRFPPAAQPVWRNFALPTPEVILDATAEGCPEAIEIQSQFHQLLRYTPRGANVSAQEMLCVLQPLKVNAEALLKFLQESGDDPQDHPYRELAKFAAQLRTFMTEQENHVVRNFQVTLLIVMLHNSQMDQRILWFEYANRITPGGKPVLQIVLHKRTPDRTTITIDDRPRPVFRCCLPAAGPGLKELAWNGSELGFPDDPREYPVYIQSHVLEQVEARVPCSKPIHPIASSLLFPRFTRRTENSFLVEYRHMQHKLGYFVGVRLADCVLLKTFLFLTMQGTPESDLLYHKRRLRRSDIEFMKLDELAAFRDNEVRNDPSLVQLFEECGCGHLLTINASDLRDESPTGYAESLRKYLGSHEKFALRLPAPATPDEIAGLTLWGQKL